MTINGRLADRNIHGGAIQSAIVRVLSPQGEVIAETKTSEVGYFTISNPGIEIGDVVQFIHPSFYDASVTVTGSTSLGFVYMDRKPEVAERIEPTEPPPTKNNALWLIAVALGLLYVFSNKKRR